MARRPAFASGVWPMAWAFLLWAAGVGHAVAAQQIAGTVVFGTIAVPGAVVTATNGAVTRVTSTHEDGVFRLAGLTEGAWSIEVALTGFVLNVHHIVVPEREALRVELALLSSDAMVRTAEAVPFLLQSLDAVTHDDGTLVVMGSVHNSAASPFAQGASFGNHTPAPPSPYDGSLDVQAGTSAWDSRPYTLDGRTDGGADYLNLRFKGTLGGPLAVPHLFGRGTVFYLDAERRSDTQRASQLARVPDPGERIGDFSAFAVVPRDPDTGKPFPGGVIPPGRISPQAAALLEYYPVPNVENSAFNYQTPTSVEARSDVANVRLMVPVNRGNQIGGAASYEHTTAASTGALRFIDVVGQRNVDATAYWNHRLSPAMAMHARYRLTRGLSETTPHFANRVDVAGDAGIMGVDRLPASWGPPRITFSSGILALDDVLPAIVDRVGHVAALEVSWHRGRHELTIGGTARVQRIGLDRQDDPRGSLTFTGMWTGSDVADFLLGKPATSAVSFGNAHKDLQGTSYAAYLVDDWRVSPTLTLNAGLRWDYESPFEERQGRLANLDVSPDFGAAGVVTASDPVGPVTGRRYAPSLVSPDVTGLQPRLGVSWRPRGGSSLVLRGGYGVYRAASGYELIATRLTAQPPFTNASVLSTAPAGVDMATVFTQQEPPRATFAVDPSFRVGYAHKWQLRVDRDIRGSLTANIAYVGTAGRRLMRAFLPNTSAPGATDKCPACPRGFVYLVSNGSSMKHAFEIGVRHRLRHGVAASLAYTWSRAIDDGVAFDGEATSPAAIAQDWRNLQAERGFSAFDRRHTVSAHFEYTTPARLVRREGLGRLFDLIWQDWTMAADLTAMSGVPLTPVLLRTVPGTSVVGTLRGDRTGAPWQGVDGRYINPAAVTPPKPGEWGTARRNAVHGPGRLLLNASVSRTLALRGSVALEVRADVVNVLNRVNVDGVNTVLGSSQFGLIRSVEPMRTLRTSVGLRF